MYREIFLLWQSKPYFVLKNLLLELKQEKAKQEKCTIIFQDNLSDVLIQQLDSVFKSLMVIMFEIILL